MTNHSFYRKYLLQLLRRRSKAHLKIMPREHIPKQTKDERKTKGYAFPLVYDEDVERSMFFNGELKILHQ